MRSHMESSKLRFYMRLTIKIFIAEAYIYYGIAFYPYTESCSGACVGTRIFRGWHEPIFVVLVDIRPIRSCRVDLNSRVVRVALPQANFLRVATRVQFSSPSQMMAIGRHLVFGHAKLKRGLNVNARSLIVHISLVLSDLSGLSIGALHAHLFDL